MKWLIKNNRLFWRTRQHPGHQLLSRQIVALHRIFVSVDKHTNKYSLLTLLNSDYSFSQINSGLCSCGRVVAESGLMAHGLVAYGQWPYVFFQLYKYISLVLHWVYMQAASTASGCLSLFKRLLRDMLWSVIPKVIPYWCHAFDDAYRLFYHTNCKQRARRTVHNYYTWGPPSDCSATWSVVLTVTYLKNLT